MPTSSPVLLALTGLSLDGGIAVVNRCVSRVLDEQVRAGCLGRTDRVLLLEDPAEPAPAPARGEQHLARGSQARFIWQAWRAFRRHRHELVLFDLVGLARSVTLPLPGFPPPRLAIWVYGFEIASPPRGLRARALRQAQLLLAISRYTADRLKSHFPELSDRIRVVQLCIDPARVAGWESAEQQMAAPRREPAALIVARMWSEERGKGHDELIETWPAVRRRVPDAELWIVGGGNDVARLVAKARDCGVADSIRFLGRVSDAELGALYRRASVFAMPSRQEGFGLVYLEAMWWGLPCIGTTADATGEVIVAGETGELVSYGDVAALGAAVVGLLSDRDRAARMGEAGRRRAREHFGCSRFRRDLLSALELD